LKHRVWLAILSGALLSSFALAQTTSHFDVAGNFSFSGSQMAGTSGSTGTRVDAIGWQTSGITHFNRWLSMTSEFSSSTASANSISLIGYTGPGTVKHYSVLAGPRINLRLKGGVTPFVQGLAGYDRADTSFTSGTTAVTGNETQIAYAFGGGAQIGLTRRVGLNVEGNYFSSEHTLAFTGWQPSHYQLSVGVVVRLFGVRDQGIAKERPHAEPTAPITGTESANARPVPSDTQAPAAVAPANTQPVAAATQADSHATAPAEPTSAQPTPPATQVASVQAPPPTIQPETKMQLAPDTAAVAPVAQQPTPAAQTVQSPAPAPKAEPVIAAAVIVTQTPAIPAPSPVTQKSVPASTPMPVSTPAPAIAAIPVVPAQQVSPTPATAPTPVAPVQQVVQAQPDQSQPVSLGEYARRLREKKQHSGSGSGSNNW
jgi:opacity protein-like surface antigen